MNRAGRGQATKGSDQVVRFALRSAEMPRIPEGNDRIGCAPSRKGRWLRVARLKRRLVDGNREARGPWTMYRNNTRE